MKQKLLLKTMLLLCILVGGASNAWADVVTFTPGTDTGATSVTKSGVTCTMSTMNNSSYYQIYANASGTFSISSGNITKIEFTCTASGTTKYGPGNASADVGSYSYSGSTGTWTGSASSVTISSTAQIRMSSLTITYTPAAPAYTITAQSNNNTYGTVSLSGSVITASPNSGYRYASPAYTVDPANSATVAQDGNAFTVTPSANTTVTINFEAIPTHTAHFSVNGTIDNGNDCTVMEGANITFPSDPANINGKKFMGWVTATIDGTTDDEPEFVTSATMSTSDVTFYAVFAAPSEGEPEEKLTQTLTYDTWTYSGTTTDKSSYRLFGNGAYVESASFDLSKLSTVKIFGGTFGGSSTYKTVTIGDGTNVWKEVEMTGTGNAKEHSFTDGTTITGTKPLRIISTCGDGKNNGIRISKIEIYALVPSVTYTDYCTSVGAAVAVTGVTIDPTSKALYVGDEFDLEATVAPANATDKGITWTSSDETKATVVNGHVTALAAGTPTITVTTTDGSFTATCELTISNVAVTGVSLNKDAATIYTGSVGNTIQLTPTIAPANATIKTVTWESSNEAIATVDENGLVSAVADGTATITVTTTDGSKTATCEITVEAAPGSAEKPYTIVQAKAAIDAGTGTSGVYVHGIISQVDSYNSTYNSITYWISDDGTTTNQFEVYGGLKSENNGSGSFSSKDDLQVGDIVTVYGDITLYKTTYEFAKDNYITSFKRKDPSDLSITSSTPVALERTSAVPSPTSTITWTTSSTGAMSFESNATGVATVSSDGVITAVGDGSATITITQAADKDYKASDEKTVTVNVTDNRFACATGIDLSSAKTILKGGSGALAANSTAADGFTGSITYSYVSDDTDIFSITDGNYTGAGVGATTVTITATPTGGNAANYKPASQEVAVTVNGTNSISLDPTSKTVAFSASTFNIAATVPTENYNGTVTAESNNTSVATVSVDGTTVTVTPVAVGTATITVTAGTGTYYLATAQAECAVEFTAPAGSTKAPSSEVTYTFDFSDNTNWSFPTDYTTGENTYTKAGKTITLNTPDDNNGYKFNSSVILFGKEGATLSLPTFDKPVTKISTTGVSGASGKVTQNIYVGSTAVSTETTSAKEDHEYEIDSEYQAAGTIYTFKVTNGNNTQLSDLTVHMYQAPTATVTLNKYGYATYCSVNPIDFSSTTGYTAWRISSIAADGTITFAKVTEKIKGGQGVLLYNKDADGVNTSNVTINFADGTTEFDDEENKFVGTTAITNITAGTYLGLKGNTFVPVNAGNIPAGKALLPASAIPASARELQFVFEDETTAIRGIENSELRMENSFFDLQGRKIAKPTKGLYIKNGKKVIVK